MYTPESTALFLPGAKSWQRRFRNVGKETLVKGFGGRTRGGTREREPWALRLLAETPRSPVPAARGNARPQRCLRAQRALRCTSGGRSRLFLSRSGFPTRPPAPGSPRLQAGDPAPRAPRARPARERLLCCTEFLLLASRTPGRRGVGRWHYEAGSPMPGWSRRGGVRAVSGCGKPCTPASAGGQA